MNARNHRSTTWRLTALLTLLLAGAFAPARAAIVTINFEGLSSMSFFDSGDPVPAAAQLSTQLLGTTGVRFRSESTSPYVAVVYLGGGHATSGVNGIAGANDAGLLTFSTSLRMEFFLPASPSTPAATDFVSLRGDLWPTSNASVSLQAFDVHGNLLATANDLDNHAVTLSISQPGIHSVLVSEVADVAWDDLSFNNAFVQVPEPSQLALVIVGLAGLVGWLRKQ